MNSLPTEVERRRRLVTRALPLSVIAAIAFAIGAATGAPGSPEKEAAERFAEAWGRKDFAAMYRELNEASRRPIGEAEFAPPTTRLQRWRRGARWRWVRRVIARGGRRGA